MEEPRAGVIGLWTRQLHSRRIQDETYCKAEDCASVGSRAQADGVTADGIDGVHGASARLNDTEGVI